MQDLTAMGDALEDTALSERLPCISIRNLGFSTFFSYLFYYT